MRKGTQFGTPQRSASISSDKNGKTDPVQALIAGAQPSSKVAKLDVSGLGKLGSCIPFSFFVLVTSHLNKGNGSLFLSIGGDTIADVFMCTLVFILSVGSFLVSILHGTIQKTKPT